MLPFVLLLFPDGTLPARRWRLVAWGTAINGLLLVASGSITPYTGGNYVFDNPAAIEALRGTILQDGMLAWYGMPVAILAATVSFVQRFRTATGQRRQQLKWFSAAAALLAFGVVFQETTWFIDRATPADFIGLGMVVWIVSVMAVPVACGIAILRYRLYDIDIIIRQALVYGHVDGRPGRHRANVDAAATLARFSTQVQRDVDIATLSEHLGEAVGQTLHPSTIMLWLRGSAA